MGSTRSSGRRIFTSRDQHMRSTLRSHGEKLAFWGALALGYVPWLKKSFTWLALPYTFARTGSKKGVDRLQDHKNTIPLIPKKCLSILYGVDRENSAESYLSGLSK